MARIIEGRNEPKANISLTHLYHLQWNKLSHQHLYWNKGSRHCTLLLLHVDYDWSCGGDNPYYPFSRPIGVVLLWSKVSEKSPCSNNIFEDAWDFPQIQHYVNLKFLVQPLLSTFFNIC